jgi:adenylyl cyclase-associated protein
MGDVADIAEGTSDNLMTAMAESIPAVGWVAVPSGPKAFVTEYADAGAFYTSKALMQARSLSADDKKRVQAFCRCMKEVYSQLAGFVRTHHDSSLVWNNKISPPRDVTF